MSNLINSDKEKIVNHVKQWRKRSGLGNKQIVARMQAGGCDISPAQFENHFTTRLEQKPNTPPERILALIQALTEGLPEQERCRIEEAIELAILAGLQLSQLGALKRFFPGQAFEAAVRRHLLALGSDSSLSDPGTATQYHHYLQQTDWGEAPHVSVFYGRQAELGDLKQWTVIDHCRLVSVLGMGGVGKTALVIKLAEQIKEQFDYIMWRSLRNAPPLAEILGECIQFLSHQRDNDLPESMDRKISKLIDYLRQQRCLLMLDNAEAILLEGERAGYYRPGYEAYGELLKRVGETRHQSCLILTSREKPKEIAALEGALHPVRSLYLEGLAEAEGRKIFRDRGAFFGTDDDWRELIERRYTGNPLALQIVSNRIQELFAGNISNFLRQDQTVSGDIGNLIEEQFNRLSELEKEVVYWLAIEREPVSISTLIEDLVSPVSQAKLLETLEYLGRRSLVEKSSPGFDIRFTLQNVIMEYVTERLIEQVCTEIRTQVLLLFQSHALIKAQAKDYLRESQTRLILQPVAGRLQAIAGPTMVENRLKHILTMLRQTQPRTPGYAGGNALNLLIQLNSDLSNFDLSQLCIWQAYLRGVTLQKVNFASADLSRSIFTETFGSVTSVAFSSDSRLLAVGTTQGEIRLWQVAQGQPLLTCQGHTNWVQAIAFSPDGRLLASGSTDQTIRLWEVSTGKCLASWSDHTGPVNDVTFSLDGRFLASGSADQTIRLWNVDSGQCLQTWSEHTHQVRSVAFSPDGQRLASGSADQTVRLWSIKAGQCLKILSGHTDWVRSVAFSPDGNSLVSGSADQTIRLWNVDSGECRQVLSEHTDRVRSVALSPDGLLLASGSEDLTVRLWETRTGKLFKTLSGHTDWVLSVAFSPDGRILASGSYNQMVRLWEANTGQCLKSLQGYTNWALAVAFSPDGRTLISGHDDHMVRLWEVETAQCLKTLPGHTDWVSSVSISPAGQTLASASADRTIRLWDAKTYQTPRVLQAHTDWVWTIAFSPDGQTLASGSQDQTIRLWRLDANQPVQILSGHTDLVRSVAFSPDGRLLASSSDDGTLRLWDADTGQILHILQAHTDWVLSVVFSPDGHTLASGSADRTIRLWDTHTGQALRTLSGHLDRIRSVTFDPTGRILASGSEDQTIRLWEAATGQPYQTLAGHSANVRQVAFNPTGDLLASASDDGAIKLWHTQSGECLRTLRPDRPYEQMNISGATGLTEAQKAALKALGAIEEE